MGIQCPYPPIGGIHRVVVDQWRTSKGCTVRSLKNPAEAAILAIERHRRVSRRTIDVDALTGYERISAERIAAVLRDLFVITPEFLAVEVESVDTATLQIDDKLSFINEQAGGCAQVGASAGIGVQHSPATCTIWRVGF